MVNTDRAAEAELVSRAKTGDSAAFSALVCRYQRPIFSLCVRYLPRTDAEDIAQETFVRAFVNREKIDPTRPPLPWLFTIARRLCLDRLRKKSPSLDEAPELGADTAAQPDAVLAAHEELGLLQQGLASLPEGQREAVVLYHLEDMSYQEVAASLAVPVGTVMTWLHRGRAKLRALVDETSHEQKGDQG